MDKPIRKIIRRWFPELVGGYHLPYFAQVVAVAAQRTEAAFCDAFHPIYSVDVQILDVRMRPDNAFPVYSNLVVPVPGAGDGRGFYGLPKKGAIVELAFARGSPSQPFIRTVLPDGYQVPGIEDGEMRWSFNDQCYQRVDKDGNWHRVTNKDVLESVENLYEQINKIRSSLALEKQIIQAPKVWLGSDAVNVLRVLNDLITVVDALATTASTHTHPGIGATTQGPDFMQHSIEAAGLSTELQPVIEE